MRKLTRDQINTIFGLSNDIESVLIYINNINIKLKKNVLNAETWRESINLVKIHLNYELSKLPDEARQHVEYLTCHPTVIAEISFPDQIKSITDGLRPGIETDQKFKDGYWKALIDVVSKENMDGNKMPLGNASIGGDIVVSKKPPSGAW